MALREPAVAPPAAAVRNGKSPCSCLVYGAVWPLFTTMRYVRWPAAVVLRLLDSAFEEV